MVGHIFIQHYLLKKNSLYYLTEVEMPYAECPVYPNSKIKINGTKYFIPFKPKYHKHIVHFLQKKKHYHLSKYKNLTALAF